MIQMEKNYVDYKFDCIIILLLIADLKEGQPVTSSEVDLWVPPSLSSSLQTSKS